jgi:FG-GAP-like repeat
MRTLAAVFWTCLLLISVSHAGEYPLHSFNKLQLTDQFWSEAPAIGDINRDGHMDIVVGPFWYEGPDFKKRHVFYPATETCKRKGANGKEEIIEGFDGALCSGDNADDTDAYFVKIADMNGDGWPDVLVVGMEPGHHPGDGSSVSASWYENPGKAGLATHALWKRHLVAEHLGSFCVDYFDLFGDGKPVLLAMQIFVGAAGGQLGYFEPDTRDPTRLWTFHPISERSADYHWATHGLGHGDVNGDGRIDALASDGWWEQPASRDHDPLWTFHPYPFALGPGQIKQSWGLYDVTSDGVATFAGVYGGSQMYVSDLNGDGLPDVVMSIAAHGHGLAWWEQLKEPDKHFETILAQYGAPVMKAPEFKRHLIVWKAPSDNPYGVEFTEMQAVAFADIDGDGLADIVTGKRFWSHGKRDLDPESNAPAVLYWFKQVRNTDGSVDFVPHLIDDNSGAGTQIAVSDVNGDGLPDIVVANKKGAFVFIQQVRSVSKEEWQKAQPPILYPNAK